MTLTEVVIIKVRPTTLRKSLKKKRYIMNITVTLGYSKLTPTKCKQELTETLCYEDVITSSSCWSPNVRCRQAYQNYPLGREKDSI